MKPHVMSRLVFGVFFLCALGHSGLALSDQCELPLPDPRWEMQLIGTQQIDKVRFMGTFELRNLDAEFPLVLSGRRREGHFQLAPNSARVQFMDLRGIWVDLLHNWGHTVDELVTLRIPPKSNAKFSFELPSKAIADRSASEFRILVMPEGAKHCIVSTGFAAMPARPPVSGYASTKSKVPAKN